MSEPKALPATGTEPDAPGGVGDLHNALGRVRKWLAENDVPLGLGEVGPELRFDDVALLVAALSPDGEVPRNLGAPSPTPQEDGR